jgi:transposase
VNWRRRVIGFVEAGGSRREAAEQFDIGVSSAIRWMQRFREDGTCEPMPRGGSTSPLEEYAQQILALSREQPELTLDEIVLALHKRRIPGSRSSLSRFFARHGITSASKGCLTPLALYLSMKLLSPPTWSVPTVGARAGNALLARFQWDIGKR